MEPRECNPCVSCVYEGPRCAAVAAAVWSTQGWQAAVTGNPSNTHLSSLRSGTLTHSDSSAGKVGFFFLFFFFLKALSVFTQCPARLTRKEKIINKIKETDGQSLLMSPSRLIQRMWRVVTSKLILTQSGENWITIQRTIFSSWIQLEKKTQNKTGRE